MFKNAQIYRLYPGIPADAFAAALESQSFAELSSNEMLRHGWISRNGKLVHVVNGQWILNLRTDKRLLPSKVVNARAKEMAKVLEDEQGFAPGKKAMKELKERAHDELLPKAFITSTTTQVWIDPQNGWLVVDTPSPSRADDVIKLLLKAVDRLPVESLRVNHSPVRMMTSWLEHDEAPAGFTVDQDATMKATGESKAQVTYKRHTLEPDAMRQHIKAGKQCTRLAMTWDNKISFVLTEALAIKSIKILDVLKENCPIARDSEERFDNDFALTAGELAKLLADLVDALGGECKQAVAA